MKTSRMFRKSIQSKFFIAFLLVMIIPTTALSVSSYFLSVKIVKEKVSQSFQENLLYIGNSTEKELAGIEKITELIYINEDIQHAITADNSNNIEFYMNLKRVDQVFDNISFYSNYYSYITSLFVFGKNGSQFTYGNDAYTINTDEIQTSAWYKTMLELNGKVLWLGVHDNDNDFRRNQVFSIARVINDTNHNNIGAIYLNLSTKVFTDILSKASLKTQSQIYIVDQRGRIVFPEQQSTKTLQSEGISLPDHIKESGLEIKKDGQTFLTSSYKIEEYGWKIIQMVPVEALTKDNKIIINVTAIVFLISFLFTGILWYLVSRNIVLPIKHLISTMKELRGSNLDVKVNVTSTDEIGLLSVTYNYMIQRINALFNQVVEEEKQKRNAEIKALQGQINPHFLYNTLNTIRWMAIIQKADGIKEVVDALGRLLKNTFRQPTSMITLGEEIVMIKDYIFIQQTRYRDKFQVNYEVEERFYAAECVKFILQPIVENAIFHGIEPKEGPGVITIKVCAEDSLLQITVEDNGVGMSDEQISETMKFRHPNRENSNGIGVQNVHNRIQMIYGEKFGLHIESKPLCYTKVHITLPLSFNQNPNDTEIR
ncbi:two-component system, sensor histidine kinase YesM [Paenibacillus algorifonticola]|uniref:Two-component system, sensor histidine kinase YesM n=1 Tax=Paenibacillus algorifonticola TaxID=684063 RepID=A0A1I2GTN5_9BACL|nr:sensor histidine kinase [Paenibacillus algorifonticola]SFF20608.1 two-component system, sensor histidine kinase YesM [Paenibacillus algorifonticola]